MFRIAFREPSFRGLILAGTIACGISALAFQARAEEEPRYIEVVWQIDGGTKGIQAKQFKELFLFLRRMREGKAYVETVALDNPDGLQAIALMAQHNLLVGDHVDPPISRFLCLINDACKTIRSNPKWIINSGDSVTVPKFDILRYTTLGFSTATLDEAPSVVVGKRKGCTSYDKSCADLVQALNAPETGAAAQQNAPTILPIEAALVTMRFDVSHATDAARKEINEHLATPRTGAEESAQAAPPIQPEPSAAKLDLLKALDDVQSAIAWRPAAADEGLVPDFGVDVIDLAFDPAHCAFAKHKIAMKVLELEPSNANAAAAATELSESDCGRVTDESQIISADPDHGTHIVGIIAGLLSEPDVFQVPIKISGLRVQPNLLGVAKYNTLLADLLLRQIRSNQTKIVNLSGGYRPDADKDDPLQKLINGSAKLALYVVAAGNDGRRLQTGDCPVQPACGPYADNRISVVAMKKGTTPAILSGKSNFGVQFDLGAPGENISSTRPGGEMIALSGSSQATAVVSAAALRLALAAPELSPKKMRDRLIYTSDLNTETVGDLFGGRVDVARALDFSVDTLTVVDPAGNKTSYRGRLLLSDEPHRERSFARGNPDIFTYMEVGRTDWDGSVRTSRVKRVKMLDDKTWVIFYADATTQRLTRALARKFAQTEGWFVTETGDDVKFVWSDVADYQSCIREEADQCFHR